MEASSLYSRLKLLFTGSSVGDDPGESGYSPVPFASTRSHLTINNLRKHHGDTKNDNPVVKMAGIDVVIDDEDWLWVMVLPIVQRRSEWPMADIAHPDPVGYGKKLFTTHARNFFESNPFRKGMTYADYHEKARELLAKLLAGPLMGLGLETSLSIDDDEIFLRIRVPDWSHVRELAQIYAFHLPVKPQSYDRGTAGCPTLSYHKMEDTFDGDEYCPLYMAYNVDLADKFQRVREIDALRLVWKRMLNYIELPEMEKQGILCNFFPVHRTHELMKFYNSGWCRVSHAVRLPNYTNINDVRDYFGEEVAFLFLWLAFYTRMLAIPAATACLAMAYNAWCRDDALLLSYGGYSFACFVLIWSMLCGQFFDQFASLKTEQWGMRDCEMMGLALVNSQYDLRRAGTIKEYFRRVLHWILAVVFLIETLYSVLYMSRIRSHVHRNPDKLFYGVSSVAAMKLCRIAMTANIQATAELWKYISPRLTSLENHRTKGHTKIAKVKKLFVVKAFVYLWPFLYVAFFKDHIEGCPGDPSCLNELRQNLWVYFVFRIGYVIVVWILLPLFRTLYKIFDEARVAKASESSYTLLQMQAKAPEYTDDTDDFMELVFSLNFVTMFAMVLPAMPILAFLSSLLYVRLLAWRMCYINQRTDPRGQEGIGVWTEITHILTWASLIVNVALAIFVLPPARDLPVHQKLALFVVTEHLAIAMRLLLGNAISKKPPLLDRIQEVNRDRLNELYTGSGETKRFDTSDQPDLSLTRARRDQTGGDGSRDRSRALARVDDASA